MNVSDQINLAIAVVSAVTALASLAVMFATFKMLRTNREVVEVMREQVRSLGRPYVQVTPWVRTGTTLMMLSIRNAGSTNAKDLRLTLDRDFFINGDSSARSLRSYSAFTEVIQCFPPHAEITFSLGVGHVVFGGSGLCPSQFTVTASYSFGSELVTESTVVDLQPFRYAAQPVDPVAEQIEKLGERLEKMSKRGAT